MNAVDEEVQARSEGGATPVARAVAALTEVARQHRIVGAGTEGEHSEPEDFDGALARLERRDARRGPASRGDDLPRTPQQSMTS